MNDKRFLGVLLVAVLLLGLIIGTTLKFSRGSGLWAVRGEVGGMKLKEGNLEALTDNLVGLGLVSEGRDKYLSRKGLVVVEIVLEKLNGVPGYESVVTLNEGRFVLMKSKSYFEDKKKFVIMIELGEALLKESADLYEDLGESPELARNMRLVDHLVFHLLWNSERARRQDLDEIKDLQANLVAKFSPQQGNTQSPWPIYLEINSK